MKAFGFATSLHNGSNFRNFCIKNGVTYNGFGAMVWDASLSNCQTGLRNIHHTLYNAVGLASRMTRDMFGSIFPDNRVSADAFDLGSNTDKLNKVYDVMDAELAALDERSKTYKEHHFAIMMKARRHSELLKVPTMVEWIEDMFDEGISPVVFINFQDTLEAIEKRLSKYKKFEGMIARVVGGQSDKQRNSDVELFQSDTKRIMLVNLAAGNAGLSLHDLNGKFPRMSLINPSWSAFHLVQALGRIHRAEGKTPCVQRIMFAAGTIEERQRQRVDTKIKNIDLLNDGDLSFEINLY
jgi:SNF2 family DNA or RNA helicase